MQPSDWNDYQAFLAIARAGQLARAASAMGVDATTMGRRLRRLEARVGATLFEQTREGQVLTEAGEAMLVDVEAMEQAASRIAERGGIGRAFGPAAGEPVRRLRHLVRRAARPASRKRTRA
jgi:DNA-binding transcriptional LysR family regulator